MPVIVYPENFSALKFCAKYNIPIERIICSWPNYLHYPIGLEITEADLLDCIADPPGPPLPTVAERLEAAELFLGLLLDQEVTQ